MFVLANSYAGATSLNHHFYTQTPQYASMPVLAKIIYEPPLNFVHNQHQNSLDYYAVTNFQPESSQKIGLPEISQLYTNIQMNQMDKFDKQQSSNVVKKPIHKSNELKSKNHPFNDTQQSLNVVKKPINDNNLLTGKNKVLNISTQSPKPESFTTKKLFKAPLTFEKDSEVQKNSSKNKTLEKKKVFSKQKNLKSAKKLTKQKPVKKDSDEKEHEYYYVYDDEPIKLAF